MSEVLGGIALGIPKFFIISPYSDPKCTFGLRLKIKKKNDPEKKE